MDNGITIFRINQLLWIVIIILYFLPFDYQVSLVGSEPPSLQFILVLLGFISILLVSFISVFLFAFRAIRNQKEQSCHNRIILNIGISVSIFLFPFIMDESLTYIYITMFKALIVIMAASPAFRLSLFFFTINKADKILVTNNLKTFFNSIEQYCCYALNNYAWIMLLSLFLL